MPVFSIFSGRKSLFLFRKRTLGLCCPLFFCFQTKMFSALYLNIYCFISSLRSAVIFWTSLQKYRIFELFTVSAKAKLRFAYIFSFPWKIFRDHKCNFGGSHSVSIFGIEFHFFRIIFFIVMQRWYKSVFFSSKIQQDAKMQW